MKNLLGVFTLSILEVAYENVTDDYKRNRASQKAFVRLNTSLLRAERSG
jgi:hypothetical protein